MYTAAIYLAGRAVECVLRSYLTDDPLETGHDLRALLRDSGFLDLLPARHRSAVAESLGEVWSRWENNHRYRSYLATKRFLTKRKVDLRSNGDHVKEPARMTTEHAMRIVERGAAQWRAL